MSQLIESLCPMCKQPLGSNFLDLSVICESCEQVTKFRNIGGVQSIYRFSKKDLDALTPFTVIRGKNNKEKTVFMQKDIDDLVAKTYGSLDEMKATFRKKKEDKRERSSNAMESRELKLTKLLNERGLELREDSDLCRTYVQCDIGEVRKKVSTIKTVKDIVDLMQEMDFLYKYTNYAEDAAKAHLREKQQYEHYIDMREMGLCNDSDVSYNGAMNHRERKEELNRSLEEAKKKAVHTYIKSEDAELDIIPEHVFEKYNCSDLQ